MKAILSILFSIGGLFYFSEDIEKIGSKEKLGEKLFFEKAFSSDRTISCASCHIPEFAFSDTIAFSVGVNNKKGLRNAPSVMNMAARSSIFYDGRAQDLKDQVHFPIADKNEMNFTIDKVAKRLNKDKKYQSWFREIYNEKADAENIADAIAAFEMTLETSDTDFDRWMADQSNNMTEAAVRGRELFMSKKAKCFDCHFSPDFTGDEFRNVGLYDEKQFMDKGRYDVTKRDEDKGKFKVPGLRNVEVTAPYMHNGMFSTLEEVVDYYDNPYKFVSKPINMDSLLIKPLNLSSQEKSDLVSFLKSLTDYQFKKKA